MTKSKVFWTNYRTKELSILSKFERLLKDSGLLDKIEKGDLVAIKIHPGLYGSVRCLRPVYVRKVVELLKKKGARPFITETVGHNLSEPEGQQKDIFVK